jgi:hypothetical protein
MNEEQKLKIKDKRWRLNNFYTIVDKNQNAVIFKQNAAQAHFQENKHVRNIILKSRQLGMTTNGAVDCLDDMAFNPNTHILFLAHIKEEAQRIFAHKIKYAWENFKLSKYYEDIKSDAGTLEIGFGKSKDGGQFDGAHSSIYVSNSGRSGTYARIHVTELAKMEHVNAERTREFIRGTIPALPIQCRIDIESTAEGDYGLFYEMFKNAMERWSFMEKNGIKPMSTDWKPHFYNWTWDKEEISKVERIIPMSEMRNADFFMNLKSQHALSDNEISYYYIKYQSLNYDMEALKQEYPTTWQDAFVSSGGKFFSPELLQNQRSRIGVKQGNWVIYTKYDVTHTYVMGVDTAGGRGGDNAVICILDSITGEQVAEFASDKTEPHILAIEAVTWAKKYGNAFMVPEINNHGLAFVNKVKDLNYYNVYSRMVYDKDTDEERSEIGFNTNVKTKPLLLYGLSFALSEMSILVYSEQLLKELQAFPKRQLDDHPTIKQVRSGQLKHFDRVIALALAWEGVKNGITDKVRTETYVS